ncbi:hypothetical protein ABK040_007466 [Willaertia magna]
MSLNDKNRSASLTDLSHFDIHFEAVLDHKPTYNCFKEFLHTSHNNEIIQFLDYVDEYKTIKSEKNREQKATEILDKFIKDKANYEVNLQADQKQKVIQEIKKSNFHKHLFDEVESSILYSLKESQFIQFLESNTFKSYVKNNNIGVLHEIGGLKINSPMKLVDNLADLKSDVFTLRDVKFLKQQLTSDPADDWEVITKSKNYFLYFSKQSYTFGSCNGAQFWRQDTTVPCKAEQLLSTVCELEYRSGWDGNAYDIQQFHYHNIEKQENFDDRPLASTVIAEWLKLGFFLTDREMPCTYTAVYDKSINAYFMCRKTCESQYFPTQRKGTIRGSGIYGIMIQDIGENECKFNQVVFADFKGNIPRAMIGSVIKNRAKHMQKNILKYVELNAKKDYICNNDGKILQTLKDNQEAGVEL